MASFVLRVNGQTLGPVESDPEKSLQLVLRDDLGLTGTKYGCGAGQCGCCTVLVEGTPVRSCVTPVSRALDREITTIEGLAPPGGLHPLQQAWIDVQAPQCGYCQPGQIMEAAALLTANSAPSDQEVREALAGHVCRCGTYNRLIQAVQLAATRMRGSVA